MKFDPAMVQRIREKGFDGVEFKIESIIQVNSLPMLLGLREDELQEQLAGV